MFPYIMITATLIFFSAGWHESVLSRLGGGLEREKNELIDEPVKAGWSFISVALVCYVLVQVYLPLRHIQYSDNLFWHEQGYRFSWRVMLMEKNGLTNIILRDPVKDIRKELDQNMYLTPFQKQQMRAQPDMLLQFANFVGTRFEMDHGYAPEVYVKSRISLNGRRSQPFTNDTLDVYGLGDPMAQGFIVPFKADVK